MTVSACGGGEDTASGGGTTTASSGTPTPQGQPPAGTNKAFQCSFETSPTDCGFALETTAASNRASIVNVGRDGGTAVRLRTEPGDVDEFGAGQQRTDLSLTESETGCHPGREQWWEHSILFPDDFTVPANGWYVVFDFHNVGPGGQALFHVDASHYNDGEGLWLRGYGGQLSSSSDTPGLYQVQVKVGKIARNVWYDFVYHVKWSSGSDGFFTAWVNGAQVLARTGPTLYRDTAGITRGCFLKLANYHTTVGVTTSVLHDRVIRYDVTGQ